MYLVFKILTSQNLIRSSRLLGRGCSQFENFKIREIRNKPKKIISEVFRIFKSIKPFVNKSNGLKISSKKPFVAKKMMSRGKAKMLFAKSWIIDKELSRTVSSCLEMCKMRRKEGAINLHNLKKLYKI